MSDIIENTEETDEVTDNTVENTTEDTTENTEDTTVSTNETPTVPICVNCMYCCKSEEGHCFEPLCISPKNIVKDYITGIIKAFPCAKFNYYGECLNFVQMPDEESSGTDDNTTDDTPATEPDGADDTTTETPEQDSSDESGNP